MIAHRPTGARMPIISVSTLELLLLEYLSPYWAKILGQESASEQCIMLLCLGCLKQAKKIMRVSSEFLIGALKWI